MTHLSIPSFPFSVISRLCFNLQCFFIALLLSSVFFQGFAFTFNGFSRPCFYLQCFFTAPLLPMHTTPMSSYGLLYINQFLLSNPFVIVSTFKKSMLTRCSCHFYFHWLKFSQNIIFYLKLEILKKLLNGNS